MTSNIENATRNIGRIIVLLIAISVSCPLIVMNRNFYNQPVRVTDEYIDPVVFRQLNYLDWSIDNGGPARMQFLFPEGAFFMYSLHTLSWTQVAQRSAPDSPERNRALDKAYAGLNSMEDELESFLDLQELSPPFGAFFGGWINWARGAILSIDTTDNRASEVLHDFRISCGNIAQAYNNSSTPFLESYVEMSWPSDNIVSIASLAFHDHLFMPKYDSTVARWLNMTRERLDPATGMIPYQTDPETGFSIDGAHGNSQAVIIRFLAELDPVFAREQYQLYCKNFPTTRLGLHLVQEYPRGVKGYGNIDSGPVIWGIGSASTIVAPVAMRLFGDFDRCYRIENSIDALGFPFDLGGKRRYAFGTMPMADAFLVWSRLVSLYTQNIPPVTIGADHSGWRVPFHITILVLLFAAWLPFGLTFVRKGWWKKA